MVTIKLPTKQTEDKTKHAIDSFFVNLEIDQDLANGDLESFDNKLNDNSIEDYLQEHNAYKVMI